MKFLYETAHYNCKTKVIYPPKDFITYNCDENKHKSQIAKRHKNP